LQLGARIIAAAGDIVLAMSRASSTARREFGRIDILINNAPRRPGGFMK
jgi:NAD(P)-dependent dehydrogenase (short-subunit alcohol dehydrogenase family)